MQYTTSKRFYYNGHESWYRMSAIEDDSLNKVKNPQKQEEIVIYKLTYKLQLDFIII